MYSKRKIVFMSVVALVVTVSLAMLYSKHVCDYRYKLSTFTEFIIISF